MTIQMQEISAAKFHNNRKGGKKMLEENVNSIGQFLKFIGHYSRLLNINELIFNGFFNWLKELWHGNIAVLGQIFADQLIT